MITCFTHQLTGVSAGSASGHCVADAGERWGLTGQSGGVCNVIYTSIPTDGYTCIHGVVLDHVIYYNHFRSSKINL